jgi:vacuolar-type H+-ATPase subunit F/Vma7
MSLFVLGEPPVVEAFALIGVPGDTPAPGQDVGEVVAELAARKSVRLVLVQTHFAGQLTDAWLDWLARKHSCVVAEIPGLDGTPSDAAPFRRHVQSAIGVLS